MTLISAEGIDGSGKSTVVDAIVDQYPDAVATSEPSDLWTGKQVRRCLTDENIDPLVSFYLFMADRVNHIEEVVRPMDESEKLVVSDRYVDSTRAYQPVSFQNSGHFPSQSAANIFIEETMGAWEYKPDLTIYIDVSVDTAMNRCDGEDKYENREFLTDVKRNYELIASAEPERFVTIDGEQSEEEVAQDALSALDLPLIDRI